MYTSRIADSRDSDQFATMMCPHDNNWIVTERGSFKAQGTFSPLAVWTRSKLARACAAFPTSSALGSG
jgi:hypothetical protein